MTLHRPLLLAVLLAAGCDKPPAAGPPSTRPAAPATCTITIGGRPVEFPRARLVTAEAGASELLLFSDDPPASHPTASRFAFTLCPDGPSDALIGAECPLRSPSADRQDSPEGIFLLDPPAQLQPLDALVTLREEGGLVVIRLHGTFTLFADGATKGAPVALEGELRAVLETAGHEASR